MDPATGGVVALYGGRDYLTQQYDDATQSAPQAGSTFKPFALAAALENGVGLSSKWDGHSPQTVQGPSGPYVVKNYGGESFGQLTLLKATEDSVNTVYVPLTLQVGTEKVVDAARRAGVPESVPIDNGPDGRAGHCVADGARHGECVRDVRRGRDLPGAAHGASRSRRRAAASSTRPR